MNPERRRPFRSLDWRKRTLGLVAGVALTATGCSASENTHFEGGCDTFVVYAQNRWEPYGAAEREGPGIKTQKIGGYAPNEPVIVDGWVRTGVDVYPDNPPPFNSDVWFHDVNDPHGFISFAGVRAQLTRPDLTLQANGGPPAPLAANCEGIYIK